LCLLASGPRVIQGLKIMSKKLGIERTGNLERIESLINRYPNQLLSAILFFALILRVMALLSLKESIYFDFLLWDERLYHAWATELAKGTFQSSSVYEMAPLPAYFMALIYRLFSPDIIYIRIANIILGVFTCHLVYLIGKELANKTAGLLACLIAALYKPFIFYSIVPLKTSLSVFLFAATVYSLAAGLNKKSILYALSLGIFMGLLNNVRPNAVVLMPWLFLLIILGSYKEKRSLKIIATMLMLYVAGLALVQSPFMIRNYLTAGVSKPTTSQSGFHLYMSNNIDYPDGIPFKTTVPAEQGIQFTIEASRREGEKLSPQEASSYWTQQAIKGSLEHPGQTVMRFGIKTLEFFNWFEPGDHYDIGFISDFVKFFKIPFFSFWLILPFGMAGMAVAILRSKKVLAVSSVFFVYGATLILFFTNIRMRIPVLVILIPLAAMGILKLASFISERQYKKIKTYLVVLPAFFIVELLPVQDSKDMTAFLNTHAIILNSKGFEEEAIHYWEESSKLRKHYSVFADLALAGKYLSEGNLEKTMNYISNISDGSFAVAQKYDMIGDIMVSQGQLDNAVRAYEKALEINSGLRTTRTKLIKVLWRIDKQKALEEYERLEYINSFYILYGSKEENSGLLVEE